MSIRDRIKSLRRVRAGDLAPNPRNWRDHSETQRSALLGVLEEIGYADALLAREKKDKTLEIIDGHLRAEVTPDEKVPVLVLDVTREEADKIMLTHDPLASMAEANREALSALLGKISFEAPAVQQMLEGMRADLSDQTVQPPEEFREYDEKIPVTHQCPKCGYEWSE